MRTIRLVIIVLLFVGFGCAFGAELRDISSETVAGVMAKADKSHPRLFMDDGKLAELKKKIEGDIELEKYNKALIYRANIYLGKEPCERKLEGRRLLGVSREVLARVSILSWAYRMTGDVKYKDRCVAEMLAVSEFSDWNPSHFLDVGEMTAALAIGYDWLYNDMDDQTRAKVRGAIVEKGLEISLEKDGRKHWWVNTTNNWNQVCHGGLVCGALAVMEDEKELAEFVVHRAVNKVQMAMNEYEPDGAYPEGPGYWSYGTTFNVILLAALDSVLGDDFGLGDHESFLKSAEYYLFATGPTGLYFNYADCGSRGGFNPAVYWFAKKTGDASLAWWQDKLWDKYIESEPSKLVGGRTSVLGLLWKTDEQKEPEQLSYIAKGRNPVAMFRSGWDDDAMYLGIKGGTPSSNHAHMDVGSFVLDAMGERWAWDLGAENYNKIEQMGMNLWSMSQDSDRWKIFRYNNTGHNTLVVNDKHQNVKGFGEMAEGEDGSVTIDMSDVYKKDDMKFAYRNIEFFPNDKMVHIGDALFVGEGAIKVRWQLLTKADIEILSDSDAVLRQNGKEVKIYASLSKHKEGKVVSIEHPKLEIFSAEPKEKWDAENKGFKFIGFEVDLEPNANFGLDVMLNFNQKKD